MREGNAQLLLGDFQTRGTDIPDSSCDLIATDPPYSQDCLPLWEDLGKFAQVKLKPGGLLISYSGVLYLPQIHTMLGRHLEYLWTAAIYHTGAQKLVSAVKIEQAWKPILIYYKPPLTKYWKPFTDMVSGGQAKEHYEWEQAMSEAAHYLQALCPPNGTIIDPMMGSATWLVAALKLNRGIHCIGIEVDKAAYAVAEERMKATMSDINNKQNCSEQ